MKAFFRRFTGFVFLLAFILLFTSCAEYHVAIPMTNNPDTAPPTPGSNYNGTVTSWSFAWGLITDGGVQVKGCTECGMQDVKITRDFFQQSLSIVTLGLVAPMNIQWKCEAAPAREGDLGGN